MVTATGTATSGAGYSVGIGGGYGESMGRGGSVTLSGGTVTIRGDIRALAADDIRLPATPYVWEKSASYDGNGKTTGTYPGTAFSNSDSPRHVKILEPDFAPFTTPPMIAAGDTHTVALKSDGTVWSWGYNASGQLGDGRTIRQVEPVQVTGLTSVTAIAAGFGHSVALRSDGTVWVWGDNSSGQLGDGTERDRSTPVPVMASGSVPLDDVIAIEASGYYSVALKSDGTVWCWGGQLSR